jgi:multidrug efflux pump
MLARFFVDRPIFATVLSIVIPLVGLVALIRMPIAQYPEVAPPTIQVVATYPGANPQTVAETVAFPIEQEVNGVEHMLYMSSRCTDDGVMTLNVVFQLGTNLDQAQVLVQNRVAVAVARLPDEVQRIGVTTKKRSPSMLLAVNVYSPDGRFDNLYVSNYATIHIRDAISRLEGVGEAAILGGRDYSMRIWLDPEKLAAREMTATDVTRAIQEQNAEIAAGRLGEPPVSPGKAVSFQVPVNARGRLVEPEEFGRIVIKTGADGRVVHLRDVASVELGARSYDASSYLDGRPAVTLGVFQLPGANALETAKAVRAKMDELAAHFPPGIKHEIVYDTTVFIEESVSEVLKTLVEAFVLVFIVVLVFLGDWRATILPMIDVPVSLVGTFAVMSWLGFSFNNLTLFGLVLAIGIVVDDAIVVVENISRWMGKGLPAREATLKAMEEITGPIIAITLVLSSVFIPTAFLAGISGQFYRQFALTIAASTIISALNAMTMAPARAVLIIKPHTTGHRTEVLPPWGIVLIVGAVGYRLLTGRVLALAHVDQGTAAWGLRVAVFAAGAGLGWLVHRLVNRALGSVLAGFNRGFDRISAGYGSVVRGLLRGAAIVVVLYVGLLGLTYAASQVVPGGFIPEQDKGYLFVNLQLPEGASLGRTEDLSRKIAEDARRTPGVAHTIEVPGFSPLLGANLSNMGAIFVILSPFEERKGRPALSGPAIAQQLRAKVALYREGLTGVFPPPPVEGIGTTGGVKVQVQDRSGAGPRALAGAAANLARVGFQTPGLLVVLSSFTVSTPQIQLEIDREKAKFEGVSLDEINGALRTYLGTAYVNDFTFQDRNWQVNVQADPAFRTRAEDIRRIEVRNGAGSRVPLGTLVKARPAAGPAYVDHYNLYPSAEVLAVLAPGTSSAQGMGAIEGIASEQLPSTLTFEWTELSLQEKLAGQDLLAKLVFPLAVTFVFLVLAALYESWTLPLAILLVVPLCILAALTGLFVVHLPNDLFAQIGLVVLIALAAKNAILIVEFATQLEREGKPRRDAIVEAARVRLRPILMTSFAFILGVAPLVFATGAGAEMRVSLGVAVFSGMIGVTLFGLVLTPVFYLVVRRLGEGRRAGVTAQPTHATKDAKTGPSFNTAATPS